MTTRGRDGGTDLPFMGALGATRYEPAFLAGADGVARRVDIVRAVNAATDPALAAAAVEGTLHKVDGFGALAVPFIFHDPGARRFALVVPAARAHEELTLRAELLTRLASDASSPIPAYAREARAVLGAEGLRRYLAEPPEGAPAGRASAEASEALAKREERLRAREEELRAREEAAAQRLTEARAREEGARRAAEELRAREEDLRQREERLRERAEDVTEREDELRQRAEDVELARGDLAVREQELERRLSDLMAREEEAIDEARSLQANKSALQSRERMLAARAEAHAEREREVAEREAEAARSIAEAAAAAAEAAAAAAAPEEIEAEPIEAQDDEPHAEPEPEPEEVEAEPEPEEETLAAAPGVAQSAPAASAGQSTEAPSETLEAEELGQDDLEPASGAAPSGAPAVPPAWAARGQDAYAAVVDGEVRLWVKGAADQAARLSQGGATLVLQADPDSPLPLAVLAVTGGERGSNERFARVVLDHTRPDDRAVLETLARDFRVRVELVSGAGRALGSHAVAAPGEANAQRVLAALGPRATGSEEARKAESERLMREGLKSDAGAELERALEDETQLATAAGAERAARAYEPLLDKAKLERFVLASGVPAARLDALGKRGGIL